MLLYQKEILQIISFWEYLIYNAISVPSSSKENGEPHLRQQGHPGHEDGHAGQHSPPPSRDEDSAHRDVLWEMRGDHPRHLQAAIARIASRRSMLPVMLTPLSF